MTAPALLRDALEPWCVAGATGALRLLTPPGGAVHLWDGRITYAESAVACPLRRLLTGSGRISGEAWRVAVAAVRAGATLADQLVRPGLLAATELETVLLDALHSATFQLLDTAGQTRFAVGIRHPAAGLVGVELDAAVAEAARRRRALDAAWPHESVDRSPVVPVPHLPGQHVVLSALQWEVLTNAGRSRTPVDLVRLLGRDTYATLLAVRRLAGAGLLVAQPVPVGKQPEPPPPAPPEPARPARAPRTVRATAALPRREIRADAWPPAPDPDPRPDWPETVLLRIRDALQALP